MKYLYYTIELGVEWSNESTPNLTGNKTISIYLIEDCEIELKHTIEATIEDNTEESICYHLEHVGDTEEYEFRLL